MACYSLECPHCGSPCFAREENLYSDDEEEYCACCGIHVSVSLGDELDLPEDADPDDLLPQYSAYLEADEECQLCPDCNDNKIYDYENEELVPGSPVDKKCPRCNKIWIKADGTGPVWRFTIHGVPANKEK